MRIQPTAAPTPRMFRLVGRAAEREESRSVDEQLAWVQDRMGGKWDQELRVERVVYLNWTEMDAQTQDADVQSTPSRMPYTAQVHVRSGYHTQYGTCMYIRTT
jgi:hypothetical protein